MGTRRLIDEERALRDEALGEAISTEVPPPAPVDPMELAELEAFPVAPTAPPMVEAPPEQKDDLTLHGPDVSPEKYSRLSQIAYALGAGTAVPKDVLAAPKDTDRAAQLREALLSAKIDALRKGKVGPDGKPLKPDMDPDSSYSKVMLAAMAAQYPDSPVVKALLAGGAPGKATAAFVSTPVKVDSFEHKKGEDQIKHEETAKRLAAAEQRATEVQQRFSGTKMEAFAEKTKDIAPLAGALEEVEQIAPGLTRGVVAQDVGEHLGVTAKVLAQLPAGLGRRFTPVDAQKLQTAIGIVKQYFMRPLAGANLTPQEAEEFKKILNTEVLNRPEAQAAALDVLRRVIGRKLKRAEGTYRTVVQDPDMWTIYKSNGGLAYSGNPLWSDMDSDQPAALAPVPKPMPTAVPVQEPAGMPTPPAAAPVAPRPVAPSPAPGPVPTKSSLPPGEYKDRNGVVWVVDAAGNKVRKP